MVWSVNILQLSKTSEESMTTDTEIKANRHLHSSEALEQRASVQKPISPISEMKTLWESQDFAEHTDIFLLVRVKKYDRGSVLEKFDWFALIRNFLSKLT